MYSTPLFFRWSFRPLSYRSSASGLSLVELLVSIAVVAVLSSVLILGVKEVRMRAKHTQCASNLRSHGQGFALFIVENGGAFPGSGPDRDGRIYRWMHRIGPYMNLSGDVASRSTIEAGEISILVDAYAHPVFHSPFTDPSAYSRNAATYESMGIYGGNPNILLRNRMIGLRVSEILNPGNTVLLAERYAGGFGEDLAVGAVLNLQGAYPDHPLGPAANTASTRPGAATGMCNVLFADFHVKQIDLSTIDWMDANSDSPSGAIRYNP